MTDKLKEATALSTLSIKPSYADSYRRSLFSDYKGPIMRITKNEPDENGEFPHMDVYCKPDGTPDWDPVLKWLDGKDGYAALCDQTRRYKHDG